MCELSIFNLIENDYKDNYAVITGSKRKERVFVWSFCFLQPCIYYWFYVYKCVFKTTTIKKKLRNRCTCYNKKHFSYPSVKNSEFFLN
jgi:hypothetical protein